MARVAYLDCGSGISGDMTLAALVDAGVSLEALNAAVGSLGLPGCRLRAEEVKKNGFRATQVSVDYEPEHTHRHLHHILTMIEAGNLNQRQKELAGRIFRRLAEAEAKVHGTTIEKVHFHEVGAADSIADIVGAAVGWDLLGMDRLVASPVPTGMGKIRIAHGECSIPAPATAELLCGIPLAESAIAGELTTPTGAAILATLADQFGPLPAMKIERIGYGAGQKDFAERPNILRLMLGETAEAAAAAADQVCVLETNLDDISGELVGYCTTPPVGVGRIGRFYHGHPNEEESAGREAHGALPAGRRTGRRGCPFPRDDHLGRAAMDGRPGRAPPRAAHGDHALGAGGRQGRLAPGQAAAFRPRVRVLPPAGRGARAGVAGGLRGGTKGV